MSLVHSLSDTGHKSSQIPSNHLRAHLPSGMHNTGIILLHARLLYAASKHVLIRPVTMETRCFHKKLEFQRYPPNDFCTARYERKSLKKKFQTFQKKPKKIIPGPILGQDRPEKNPAKCLFEAARFRVLDGHRATKPTTAPLNLNGARPLGAPTHPLVTVFTKRPVIGGERLPGV